MKNYDAAFARLKKSKFRSRFHLSEADRKYIADKGLETIRSHCEDFIRTRLAPASPPKIQRLYTNMSWLTMATPDIGSVPTWPTMMLSSRLTKFVMTFWIRIGIRIAKSFP